MKRLKQSERDLVQCTIAGIIIDIDKNLYNIRCRLCDNSGEMIKLANAQFKELDKMGEGVQELIDKIVGNPT